MPFLKLQLSSNLVSQKREFCKKFQFEWFTVMVATNFM